MESIRLTKAGNVGKILVIVLLVSSCISQKKIRLLQDKNLKQAQTSFENKKKTEYQVQSGDHLYIKVYSQDPKTSKFFQSDMPSLMNPTYLYLNSYMVDTEGYINFSFIDKMYVKGMTIDEVRKKVQTSLNEYFKETTVTAKLINFQIAILGEVGSPGNFTIDKDQINVLQAIAMAGGIKEFGNNRKVKLVRQTLKGSEVYHLNLGDSKILESDYFYLMPNDIIYVEPMNAKTWAYSTFPYSMVFSVISIGLSVYVLVNSLK
jgi:polysaccharide export outer membrane protein